MTGDDLEELMPLRIQHRPGKVPEVIVETFESDTSSTPSTQYIQPQLHPQAALAPAMDSVSSVHTITHPTTMASSSLLECKSAKDDGGRAIYCTTTRDDTLIPSMGMEAQLSFQRYHQLYNSYFQAIMSGQVIQATGIKDVIDKHFGSLKEEMDKNKALQVQVFQMQQTIEENQLTILKMQQQALDRLAILQNNIQALLTQTYELHEYPIP
ncbi:MAG: hypothetical protein J3Q66DRAFT_420585 [Benniella sp.]|nr:MAG: hypothetical protein J3Q66DRAFT_420585 [Benniella sp.]